MKKSLFLITPLALAFSLASCGDRTDPYDADGITTPTPSPFPPGTTTPGYESPAPMTPGTGTVTIPDATPAMTPDQGPGMTPVPTPGGPAGPTDTL